MAQVNLGHVVGPGVPTGGSANQILVKNGSTNFDTSWKDAGTIPSIANVQDGLAIVANGNTHAAIASGQFVYVKNHGSLAEGLYRATAAIGTNATLSTSNLTADSAGGLNALKADVDSLNSNLKSLVTTQYIEIPINVNANTAISATANLALSGYASVGIVQIDFDNDNCYAMKYSIYANTLYIRVYNNSATAYSNAKCTVRVLYLKL